jgi:hypothetical protein
VRCETSDCSNAEIRMTKLETMTNDKSRTLMACFLRYSSLVLPSSFAIRTSSFGANLILSKNLASSI